MCIYQKKYLILLQINRSILKLDNEKIDIMKYGAYNIVHTLIGFLLVFITAIIFDVLFEAVIIQTVIYTLRKSSGGAHATSPNRCTILGTLIILSLSILVNRLYYINYYMLAVFAIFCCLFAYYMIYNFAPVDTPTKPIKKPERRLKFKRNSLFFLHICTAMTIVLFVLYVNYESAIIKRTIFSIWTGLAWQAFTLSHFGHLIINGLDVLMKNTTKFVTGR